VFNWIDVHGSGRITAMAYDASSETIYVRFPNGKAWWYGSCPSRVWDEFSDGMTSKGQYIARVLNHHPNGEWGG
jgi:YD repeat-containing protein